MSTAGRWVQQEKPSPTHLTKVTVLEGVGWQGHVTLQPAEGNQFLPGTWQELFLCLTGGQISSQRD